MSTSVSTANLELLPESPIVNVEVPLHALKISTVISVTRDVALIVPITLLPVAAAPNIVLVNVCASVFAESSSESSIQALPL